MFMFLGFYKTVQSDIELNTQKTILLITKRIMIEIISIFAFLITRTLY